MKPTWLLIFSFLLSVSAQGAWLDRSPAIFFPTELKDSVTLQQSFPAFWWNFIVVAATTEGQPNWVLADQLCAGLKSLSKDHLLRAECGQGLSEFQHLAEDWSRDLPLRREAPTLTEIRTALDDATAKLSLPGADRALIAVLRTDPLESWTELLARARERVRMPIPREKGFFADPETKRIVIPFQAAFPGLEAPRTAEIRRHLWEQAPGGEALWVWSGPHAASLANEEQVTTDLARVSWAGAGVLILFGILLAISRRWRLVFLLPPVFAGIALGAGLVILIQGSIHGLTLAFGTGIIGIALDYGMHAALAHDPRKVWRSNLIGFLATALGLVVLMTSAIPLVRQMMLFSASGLGFAFVALRIQFALFPNLCRIEPIALRFRPNRVAKGMVGLLLLTSAAGLVFIRPSFDLRQFDFQPVASREANAWLLKAARIRSPLFEIQSGDDPRLLEEGTAEQAWARARGITLENAAGYLPPVGTQERHLATWSGAGCDEKSKAFSVDERAIFSPFLGEVYCAETREVRTLREGDAPSYLRHLQGSGNRWLTLWLTKTPEQDAEVRAHRPDAVSLFEVVMRFPQILKRELSWMAPLAILLTFVLLSAYYRRARTAWRALIPFFTGLGLLSAAVFVFRMETSFVTVVAMVLVFGASIDFGIFASDLQRFAESEGDIAGAAEREAAAVWTALTFAMTATLIGFVPLLFCRHPVLLQLGQGLIFGSLGTYLGAIWGIPEGRVRKERKPKESSS